MLFEILLARGVDPAQLISPDTLRDANAKLMTFEEVKKTGFAGLPEPAADKVYRYITAEGRNAKWIHHMLENNSMVASMRTYEVE